VAEMRKEEGDVHEVDVYLHYTLRLLEFPLSPCVIRSGAEPQ